jgi:hypothetical protein
MFREVVSAGCVASLLLAMRSWEFAAVTALRR